MATKTKKMNIFKALFASGIDVEDYEEVTLPKELEDARKAIDAKAEEVEKGFNSGKPSQNVGARKADSNTLDKRVEAMRPKHDEVKASSKKRENKTEYEIGD